MIKIDHPDKDLIQKIIDKDDKSLISFYKQYQKTIFNYAKKQLNDTHVAEEVTQDVFFDFIESLRDFRYQCSLKTFLFSIAKNKIIDIINRKKIKKIVFSSLPAHFIEEAATIVFDDEIEKKEIARKIKKVLDRLPNDYSLILRLKYIEETKVKAIAKKLILGFKATESLLFRARRAFIKIFNSLP